jgi:hypothetical protein
MTSSASTVIGVALSLRSSFTIRLPDGDVEMPFVLADRMSTPPPRIESSNGWT